MEYALDVKESLDIGGVKQHIRIRTTDEKLPVVLFLHGGPGICDRHWVLKNQSDLASAATIVCWDQRGAGLSYDKSLKKEDMCVARMVEDAAELAEYLCKRFNREKVIVVGHSWGTLLGTLLAQKYPGRVAAYIGMGQFVDGPENERLSYQFVWDEATKRGDKKALKALTKIGRPQKGHYKNMDDLMVQRNLMTKYGGEDYGESDGIVKAILMPILRSPEYTLRDLMKYYKGAYFSLETMWEEIVDFDFNKDVTTLEVPVYLTEGRHDQNTPTEVAEKWFDALSAPHKEWIWFEESAHSPIKNEPQAWGRAVMRIIREHT